MNYEQIEMAIRAHIEAYGLFTRARFGRQSEGLAECSEKEFRARRALIDGRGDCTATETRRVSYITGFIIQSQVKVSDRLLNEVVGAL